MSRQNLHEQKWHKFLKRCWPLQYIPFIDFVFAAGSLATGNMREDSDFDVIVGAREERIFTVRFFCFLIFKPLGWWAKHPANNRQPTTDNFKDKLCFSHFVSPRSYRLSPPYNEYWKKLYLSVIPILGNTTLIQRFYRANEDWIGEARLYQENPRHKYKKDGRIKKMLEWLLEETLGDWLEKILKKIQIKKIEIAANRASVYKPRIIISDEELEFHPDTKRIQEYLKRTLE